MSAVDDQRRRLLVALSLSTSPLSTLDLWKRYLDNLGIRTRQVLAERLRVYAPSYPGREWQALPTTSLSFPVANPPDGTNAVPYSYQFVASGGTLPYTYSVSAGAVPSGLTLNSAGLLSGTPDTVALSAFTVRVTDAALVVVDVPVDVNIAA